jgi:hypothetical protein
MQSLTDKLFIQMESVIDVHGSLTLGNYDRAEIGSRVSLSICYEQRRTATVI